MRRQSEIVSRDGQLIPLFKHLKYSREVVFHRSWLVNNEDRIFQIIKDAGTVFPNDRQQPFPAGKAFAFVCKNCAVAQRASESFVAPTLASAPGPLAKVISGYRQLAHGSELSFL